METKNWERLLPTVAAAIRVVASPWMITVIKTVGSTCLIAAVVIAVVYSWNWPLALDAPVMHYIVFLIDHGSVPYRDIIDLNSPGSYFCQWLAIHVFGPGDLGWRMFDLFVLALGTAAIFVVTRPQGPFAGIFASSLFVCVHVWRGITEMGQRDFILGVLAVCGCALMLLSLRTNRSLCWFAFGFTCSAAGTIKISGFSFLAGFVLFALITCRRQGRSCRLPIIWTAAGALLPLLAVTTYLAATGGLRPFLELCFELLPLYSQMKRVTGVRLATKLSQSFSVLLPLIIIGVGGSFVERAKAASTEQLAVATGFLCGLASYWIQSKGFSYHSDPALIFLGIWVVSATGALFASRIEIVRAIAVIALAYWFAFSLPAIFTRITTWGSTEPHILQELQSDIVAVRAAGHTHGIQVMETVNGGLHALYNLRLVQSTGFIYDFYFYQFPERPFVRKLRSRYMRELNAGRPDIIVMSNSEWPHGWGFSRVNGWPEFRDNLNTAYHLEIERRWYRIYVHN